MDSQTLCEGMGLADPDYPARVAQIRFLTKVRDGKLYDHIPYAFSEERNGNGEYVPLSKRRPSVRTGICRVVVDGGKFRDAIHGDFPKNYRDKDYNDKVLYGLAAGL